VGLAAIGGLLWFWKLRRRKQAQKDIPIYDDDMVESDFGNNDKSSPHQPTTMRNFVPPAVMDEEIHSETGAGNGYQGYGTPFVNPGYDGYGHGYGNNADTSSTTAPHSEYMANLLAQRARTSMYAEGNARLGGEREQAPFSPVSNSSQKPDTQDHFAPQYVKPDSRE